MLSQFAGRMIVIILALSITNAHQKLVKIRCPILAGLHAQGDIFNPNE